MILVVLGGGAPRAGAESELRLALGMGRKNFEIPQERAYTRAEGYKFENGTTSLNKRNFQTATSTTAELENAL